MQRKHFNMSMMNLWRDMGYHCFKDPRAARGNST
jgi:hypothetical protein